MKEILGVDGKSPCEVTKTCKSTAGPPKGLRPLCGPVRSYSCRKSPVGKASIIGVNVELPIGFAGAGGWDRVVWRGTKGS